MTLGAATQAAEQPYIVGRYAIYGEIAAGGMATVHLGRLLGEAGFSRTVAIKRLHPQFAKDPDFVNMLLDEARIAARIRHPNVVSTIDVVSSAGELLLVMDYVHGESLARLIRIASSAQEYVPIGVACGIVSQALLGLHAAHEAKSERGEPLGIVHRDVSPQNIMVGADGVSQVLDFGVAKAAMRASTTREGQIKGKIAYMAPEQFGGGEMDRRVDVFACGVVLWETLTNRRLFAGQDVAETLGRIAAGRVDKPSSARPELGPELDQLVMTALALDPQQRFQTALDFAAAIERTAPMASPREIGGWVEASAAKGLEERAQHVSEVESRSTVVPRPLPEPASFSDASSAASGQFTAAPALAQQSAQPSATRKVLTLVAAGLGGAVLVLLLVLVVLPKAEKPEGVASAPSAAAAPVSAARAATDLPAEHAAAPAAAPAPSQTELADAAAGAALDAGAQLTPDAAPPRVTAKKPAVQHKPSQPARPKPANCDPPYSIDAKGIKRVKPGCL